MNGDPTKRIRRKPDPEESRIAGLALLRLRRQTGMTVGQLSARSGQPVGRPEPIRARPVRTPNERKSPPRTGCSAAAC